MHVMFFIWSLPWFFSNNFYEIHGRIFKFAVRTLSGTTLAPNEPLNLRSSIFSEATYN
jgi:hypothetical protein